MTLSEICSEPTLVPWEAELDGKHVAFGAGSLDRLGELTRTLDGSQVLLVSDRGVAEAGHRDRAARSLQEAGFRVVSFDEVVENPTTAQVEAAARVGEKHQIDLIVAVGGGSVMDCAKGANFLLTNGGRMEDYWGFGKAPRPLLPSVGVPTTAGTGSESQSYALVCQEGTHRKMACGDRKARFRVVLLDPELTLTQPLGVTALSGLDAVAHAVESYVTTRRSAISQMYARAGWRQLAASFHRVLEEPQDLEARGRMLLGAHLAGLSIEHSMLGAAHALANPLTARFGLAHGRAVSLLLPEVVHFNEAEVGGLYRELEAELDGQLADWCRELRLAAGLSDRLRDHGISRDELAGLSEQASNEWTAGFNPRAVAPPELRAIYESVY